MMDVISGLGTNIKKYRKLKKMSTNEFASAINISAGFLNNIENAKTDVFRLALLDNIAKTLNVPISDLLDRFDISLDKVFVNQNKKEICLSITLTDNIDEKVIDENLEKLMEVNAKVIACVKDLQLDKKSTGKLCEFIVQQIDLYMRVCN